MNEQFDAWFKHAVHVNANPDSLLEQLLNQGWLREDAIKEIVAAYHRCLGVTVVLGGPIQGEAAAPAIRFPAVNVEGRSWTHICDGRELDVQLINISPDIFVADNFLSHEECDALVLAAMPRLERSKTIADLGGSKLDETRTSDGMFFKRGENQLIRQIEVRISELVSWPIPRGEGLQVLRYGVGHEYKPHQDYFDIGKPSGRALVANGGQRVATLLMYLNNPVSGGGTSFPDIGLEVAPKKGRVVFFVYPQPDESSKCRHGGSPVTSGEKWVATKWLRVDNYAE